MCMSFPTRVSYLSKGELLLQVRIRWWNEMYYLKGVYAESFDERTREQYCEIGDDLYARRSVEIYRDGDMGYADLEHPGGVNGTILPEGKFPAPSDIYSVKGEFTSEIVPAEEFERVWRLALEINQNR